MVVAAVESGMYLKVAAKSTDASLKHDGGVAFV
jgi:hypothetical protein